MRRSLEFAAGLALALLPHALRAQAPATGTYRIYQGVAELGRESFRRHGDTLEQEVVVPVVNLRVTSQTSFTHGGALAGFSMTVSNAAGDTTRGSYAVTVDGDSLRITSQLGKTSRTLVRAGRALLVLPPQSIFSFVELAHRAAGRDTMVVLLVAGADTLMPAAIQFRGDSGEVHFAGLEILLRRGTAGVPELTVPVQRVRAVLAGLHDTLPRSPDCAGPRPTTAPRPARSGRRRRCGCLPARLRTPFPWPAPSPGPAPVVPPSPPR